MGPKGSAGASLSRHISCLAPHIPPHPALPAADACIESIQVSDIGAAPPTLVRYLTRLALTYKVNTMLNFVAVTSMSVSSDQTKITATYSVSGGCM